MKKTLVVLAVALTFGIISSFDNTASASTFANVPASGGGNAGRYKYYGNGLYCNQFGCKVNWGQTWSEGVQRWGDNLFGSFSGGKR